MVNFVFRTLMIEFSYLLKPTTTTQGMNWVKEAIFSVSFTNGCILIILMSAESKNPIMKNIFMGKYADFTPNWFDDIGNIIVSNLVTNAMYPLIELLLQSTIQKIKVTRD